jgi:hypothetical protein
MGKAAAQSQAIAMPRILENTLSLRFAFATKQEK